MQSWCCKFHLQYHSRNLIHRLCGYERTYVCVCVCNKWLYLCVYLYAIRQFIKIPTALNTDVTVAATANGLPSYIMLICLYVCDYRFVVLFISATLVSCTVLLG